MSHFARFLAGIYSPLVESLSSPNRNTATNEAVALCAADVRRYDPDRYVASLFAGADGRRALWTLYAFNLEIAKTRETVSEPMLGQIRLQWWRETIGGIYEGAPREHAVVTALTDLIARHDPGRARLDRLIDGREQDLEERAPESLDELLAYVDATSGELACLALELLGARDEAALAAGRQAGIAWALTGLLRAIPFHAGQGRSFLPGVAGHQLRQNRDAPAIAAAAARVAAAARDADAAFREAARAIPRSARPAVLHAVLARVDLRQLEQAGYDPVRSRGVTPFGRRARVAWAGLTGRL